MAMTRKQRRLILIGGAGGLIVLAVALFLFALREKIVIFYSPTDLAQQAIAEGTRVRIGGLVEVGSLTRGAEMVVGFRVTDGDKTVAVRYQGLLPDLFREGQGVVAEGVFEGAAGVRADTVLAKHDERYMPREVAEALKKKGVWKGGEGQ